MAATCGGGAGAVRVSGAPSGGVSGAGAAADDVGSVIDFLSGASLCVVSLLQTGRDLGSDEPTRRELPQLGLGEARASARPVQGGQGRVSMVVMGRTCNP